MGRRAARISGRGKSGTIIDKLIAELDRLREVDPARVNPDELFLFQSLMSAIRRAAPDELDKATKIIVLHHHIAPIYGEEVKQFELLLNAGQFKKLIVGEGFRLVLHGHKHWPELFTDTAISGGRGGNGDDVLTVSVFVNGTANRLNTEVYNERKIAVLPEDLERRLTPAELENTTSELRRAWREYQERAKRKR